MNFSRDLGERYSPLYFFNAFAAGGIAMSFFMYLLWAARSVYSALPSFDVVVPLVTETDVVTSLVCLVALGGFLFFTALHVVLLRWNIQSFKRWQRTTPYKAFAKATDKTVLLAIPMTVTLSMLLGLCLLLIVVPFIFSLIEFILGFALVALIWLGARAVRLYIPFFENLVTQPLAEDARGNNLGQLISMLAFTTIGLGCAILSAASTIIIVLVVAYICAAFFLALSAFLALVWFLPRLSALTEARISPESAPLLWFAITPLCLGGLSVHFQNHTLASAFGAASDAGAFFSSFCLIYAFCGLLASIGYFLIKSHGFLSRLVQGEIYAAGLYAVVCPALALLLTGHYFLNAGLAQTGLIEPWGLWYAVFALPLVVAQGAVIRLFFRLNAKLFPVQVQRKQPASRK